MEQLYGQFLPVLIVSSSAHEPRCLSLFSVAITEYLRPSDLQRIERFMLAHGSGDWEVQEHGTGICGFR